MRRKGWCEEWELGEASREEVRVRNGEDHGWEDSGTERGEKEGGGEN